MPLDLAQKRVLIFIVAYNAEKTIASVLDRIPKELHCKNVEVLIIDDSSKDQTFHAGLKKADPAADLHVTVLRNPVNQGYGGNQKLGYRYAIDRGFDIVALVHGDGQYAPEKLPDLLEPLIKGEADAVFGSRMIRKQDALDGGMPLYKWVGNQVLTKFQNQMLGTQLSEFHSGYRLYATKALAAMPFERNSNDFHFDTDIIIQLVFAGMRIKEIPIPTFYGDEVCHVNGMKYAWDIFKTMIRSGLHKVGLLYDRKFDLIQTKEYYTLKLGYASSHTMALGCVRPGSRVLDLGCGHGYVAEKMAETAASVVGVDEYPRQDPNCPVKFHKGNLDHPDQLPIDVAQFDQIFLLDIIEHLRDPETFMEHLRTAAARSRPEIVLTTANIAFAVTRFALFIGEFNYGKKGILDRTHTRLFTFRSLKELFQQCGYQVLEMKGIPAPFPHALGGNFVSRTLLALNQFGIRLLPGLFSYQIFVRAKALPTVAALLGETLEASETLAKTTALS